MFCEQKLNMSLLQIEADNVQCFMVHSFPI